MVIECELDSDLSILRLHSFKKPGFMNFFKVNRGSKNRLYYNSKLDHTIFNSVIFIDAIFQFQMSSKAMYKNII